MNELEQNAFLLHSRPFRDNQVIAEFLTEFHGKISAIVYISNSPKSSKKALLQPFIPLTIVLKGKNNLKTLSRIDARGKSFLLNGDYLYSGFYLNELQVKLLGEHIACEPLYHLYAQSLQALAQKMTIEPILRTFENTLLDELGMMIDYSSVIDSEDEFFHYIHEQGFTVAEKATQYSYKKSHLLFIAEQNITDGDVAKTYKQLMRQIINQLLGGKPLNSRKLFTKK